METKIRAKIIIFAVDGETSPIFVYICRYEQQRSEANLIEKTVESLTPVHTLTQFRRHGFFLGA